MIKNHNFSHKAYSKRKSFVVRFTECTAHPLCGMRHVDDALHCFECEAPVSLGMISLNVINVENKTQCFRLSICFRLLECRLWSRRASLWSPVPVGSLRMDRLRFEWFSNLPPTATGRARWSSGMSRWNIEFVCQRAEPSWSRNLNLSHEATNETKTVTDCVPHTLIHM